MFDSFPRPERLVYGHLTAAAIVGVLQLHPATGIWLMIMMGPFWISIILNSMVINLGLLALKDPRYQRLGIVPVVVYGAWFAFYGYEYMQIRGKIETLEAVNRLTAPVPADVDLVFQPDDRLAMDVRQYIGGGGRVFQGDDEIRGVRGGRWPDSCQKYLDTKVGERIVGTFDSVPGSGRPDGCFLARRSPGPHPGLHFRQVVQAKKPDGVSYDRYYSLDLVDAAGHAKTVGAYRYGAIEGMSPWPIFLLGCGMALAGDPWTCHAARLPLVSHHYGVSREPGWDEGGLVQSDVLGRILGRPFGQVAMQ